jgi:hypothetical protein
MVSIALAYKAVEYGPGGFSERICEGVLRGRGQAFFAPPGAMLIFKNANATPQRSSKQRDQTKQSCAALCELI